MFNINVKFFVLFMSNFYSCYNKMATFPAGFFLFLHFSFILGYSSSDEANELKWPTEYHFNVETLDFDSTIRTPSEIWYSAKQKRSRIDYYGGSNKEFYYADKKYKLMLSPVSNENMSSTMNCKIDRHTKYIRDPLPPTDGFTFTGETTNLFGKDVDIWTWNNTRYGLDMTLYVFKTDFGYDIPVQYISKRISQKHGEIEAHIITDYYNFKSTISKEELTTTEQSCLDLEKGGEDFKTNILNMHPDNPADLEKAFDSFANHHNKQYQENEMLQRREIFEKNWRLVQEHNSKNLGFKLELNDFSDRTPEELQYLAGSTSFKHLADDDDDAQAFPYTEEEIEDIVQELPQEFDLRIEGCITPVKHQSSCGSCWAFAATAAIEGALARVYGRLFDLSEQYLVDCTWTYGSNGCHGGYAKDALKLVSDYGIPTERDYGVYKAKDDYCNILNMTSPYKIKGFGKVTPLSPSALKVALYKYGPVAVRITTDPIMRQYANGIFYDVYCQDRTHDDINHAVVAVGYGNRDGEDYWIVKNSWGEAWGEDGYILMSARNNNCLLLDEPYYILV